MRVLAAPDPAALLGAADCGAAAEPQEASSATRANAASNRHRLIAGYGSTEPGPTHQPRPAGCASQATRHSFVAGDKDRRPSASASGKLLTAAGRSVVSGLRIPSDPGSAPPEPARASGEADRRLFGVCIFQTFYKAFAGRLRFRQEPRL